MTLHNTSELTRNLSGSCSQNRDICFLFQYVPVLPVLSALIFSICPTSRDTINSCGVLIFRATVTRKRRARLVGFISCINSFVYVYKCILKRFVNKTTLFHFIILVVCVTTPTLLVSLSRHVSDVRIAASCHGELCQK